MPTGARFNAAFAEKLVQFGQQHNILICHDNPYSFILNKEPQSLLQTPGAKEVVLELNSLSKSSNMAGWRVGMLVGKQEWINEVLRFKSNMDSGMFQPLQMAAVKALELGPEWYADLNKIYEGRRKKVFQLLELLNCTFDKDQVGLFVWAKIPATAKDGFSLTDEILQKTQVFITPGGIFGSNGNGYIRVSLCKDEKVFDEVLERIQSKFKS
jgi:aspartate/methionine/tyrosine aminotransferase